MFKQATIVFFKEIKCIVRDTKTFIFGLLLPLLLVPGILFAVNFSLSSFVPSSPANMSVKVAFSDKNNAFYKFCSAQSGVIINDVKDAEKALSSGQIEVYVSVDPELDEAILNSKNRDFDDFIKYKYDDTAMNGATAKALMSKYKTNFEGLVSSAGRENITAIDDMYKFLSVDLDAQISDEYGGEFDIAENISLICFVLLVPTMIVLYCGTSSMGTASELGVGEKERGTLESLLSTGADRVSIVLGKLFATTTMGAAGGFCAAIGLIAYMKFMFWGRPSQVSFLEGLYLVLITICVSLFFASVNLAISIYSKSYKEAQTYSLPFVMFCMAPTFLTYGLSPVDIDFAKLCIPMYNVACVLKEIISKSVNILHIGIVLGWLIIYSLVAIAIMVKLFKKEDVIFRI
ncbi:MAG: ABC transporter permease [Clostridia bacterium]|nr:ABC transporter permease [Clostridia bacterium]